MLSRRLLLVIAVATMLGACSKEQSAEVYTPDQNEIVLNMLHPQHTTRVSDSSFDVDDKIGVYVTQSDAELQLAGNVVNNELFVYRGDVWASMRKVYWNEGKHNIYAYYPYSNSVNDIVDFDFCVQTDQSTDEAYSQSDFLWASAKDVQASDGAVDMLFEHKMSRVIVKLVKGEEFEGEIPDNAEVYIDSTTPYAVVDLSTGDAANNAFMSPQTIRCKQLSNDTYTAIIVPQSLTSQVPLVEIIIGDVSYLMYGKISFRPGYSHTITVTLNHNPEKVKIEIGGDLGDWK